VYKYASDFFICVISSLYLAVMMNILCVAVNLVNEVKADNEYNNDLKFDDLLCLLLAL